MSQNLVKALGIACELTDTRLSEAAITIILEELALYPETAILAALQQCIKELKTRLTLADILSRVKDGRPDVEEAWALLQVGEDSTIVWTDEMREAWGLAHALGEDDPVGARMAFKEKYHALVTDARDKHLPVVWSVSLGTDRNHRHIVVREAVKAGKLAPSYAAQFLTPELSKDEAIAVLLEYAPKLLE